MTSSVEPHLKTHTMNRFPSKRFLYSLLMVAIAIIALFIVLYTMFGRKPQQYSYAWKHSDDPSDEERIKSGKECQKAFKLMGIEEDAKVMTIDSESYAPGCFESAFSETKYVFNKRTSAGGGQCTPRPGWATCVVRKNRVE